MTTLAQNTIYREMILDLCYRLRLADDLFVRVSAAVVSAASQEELEYREQAIRLLAAYAKALRVIYADFQRVQAGHRAVFPAVVEMWQWDAPDGLGQVVGTLERLHAIADGMQGRLDAELLKMEARP